MQFAPWISLVTLNASFQHCAFGLRYLKANLAELQAECRIQEFTTKMPVQQIAEKILAEEPRLVGFGVYIWNTIQTEEVIRLLRQRRPDLIIVCGGPEVSFETENQPLYELADFIVCGEGEQLFLDLCRKVRLGQTGPRDPGSKAKIVRGPLPNVQEMKLPYSLYVDDDLHNRTIYVEASRGCPYKCEYCLSSLDKEVRTFPLDAFLAEMELLLQRGVRGLKFVDRTFNLSPKVSQRILQFFLDRPQYPVFLHFEMVPDRLPEELRALIQQFPEGRLQFEVGIQTWDSSVAALVSRRQNYDRIRENLSFLRTATNVHIHADLIVGLPGETKGTFASGFDQLFALNPHEIQVGLLKRLKGTPIIRHDLRYSMKYSAKPPFTVLETSTMGSLEIEAMNSFAKWWDIIANSGRFMNWMDFVRRQSLESPFEYFARVFEQLDLEFPNNKPAPAGLTAAILKASGQTQTQYDEVLAALQEDYRQSGNSDRPRQIFAESGAMPAKRAKGNNDMVDPKGFSRQARHRKLNPN